MSDRLCALVTGAGRGLGKAIAIALGRAGYNVGVHYNTSEAGAMDTCETIRSFGSDAFPIQGDITDFDEIRSVFDSFIEHFGRIDVMINNSGANVRVPILEITKENFEMINNLNWRATVFFTQYAAKNMIDNNIHGVIINMSSVQKEVAHLNAAIYGPVKSAIFRFSKHAAMEFAPYGIRVNSVSPGMIKVMDPSLVFPREIEQSARIPLGRVGTPAEIADLVMFLVSDPAAYITGSDFCCDGGLPIPAMIDNRVFPLPEPSAR